MAADDDLVSITHLEAMRDALPNAQLAVVPGTSHALPLETPDLTARLIRDFLASEQTPDDANTVTPPGSIVERPAWLRW
jgi:hypothetical protein